MSSDKDENDDASRLRQRLWGAAVLIAIAVIVLPLILDGAGSESQFRQVERLREEPPVTEQPSVDINRQPEPEVQVSSVPAKADVIPDTLLSETAQTPLTAWVVQAAAFAEEKEAVELRDKLRTAGFASFVRDRKADTDPFRVLVGPMIRQSSAEKARQRVAVLLKNDPFIATYP